MNRKLFKSIREYKKESVLAPLYVILEVFIQPCNPYDDRCDQRTDGIHDEYPSPCESADYDCALLDYDFDDQCQDRFIVPRCHSASRRHADLYRKESAPAFYRCV